MKDIFNLSKLLIKKEIKALTKKENKDLERLQKKHPFAKKVDYGEISEKIIYHYSIDSKKAWKTLVFNNEKGVTSLNIKKWLKYAAIFIGMVGVGGYLLQTGRFSNNQIVPSGDKESITLQLENGVVEIFSNDQEQQIVNAKGQTVGVQKNGQLRYIKEVEFDELVYNELNIPWGKRLELVLSDGTHIHLNSGTSIKYPVKFIKGKNRQVFLEGEAYFDVAKDSLDSFVVSTGSVDVQVLGTIFNISAYPEDNDVNTVLVEGSVNLSSNALVEYSLILKPGYKATLNKTEEQIFIDKVDTKLYTSWTEGKLIFKDVRFDDISKSLERHYNVTIKNENETLKSERFDATFDIETIEQVLWSFKENHPTLNFTISDKNFITIY